MASPDYLRSAISEYLATEMLERGFVRVRPKEFARVRGDLVDGLSFQLSQWGSQSFYVHTWISPKCAPPNPGYLVGMRHDYDGIGAVNWIGDTKEHAELALASLRHYYLDKIEPWYQSIGDLAAFVAAYLKNHKRRRKSAEYLAMMLALGRTEEYNELLHEIDERRESQATELLALREARSEGVEQALLQSWRAENEGPIYALRRKRKSAA